MVETTHNSKGYTSVAQDAGESIQSSSHEEEFELQNLGQVEEIVEENVDNGKSSMGMAFMNMANSILGAGIIGQPFAFKNSGLVGGFIAMALLGVLIDWTLRLIVINAHLSQTRSYQDTVNYCYGRPGKYVLLFSICLFAVGGCMAFAVIIGDTIPHVLKAFVPSSITEPSSAFGWVFKRNTIIILFITCISYPLSLNDDISKLAKASGFALLGMLTIVIISVVRGASVERSLRSDLTSAEWLVNYKLFQGISVISFALVCHHNTIFIYNSLKNATLDKFRKLTHIACIVSVVFCSILGVSGMLTFGDNTKGNILNNFKSDDNWINIARFCFGLNMLTTFPLEIFVARDVVKDLVMIGKVEGNGNTAHLELTSRDHFLITTVLVFGSMAVSLFTCNLGIILELIGATSASLMAYIIPPLCYLKLSWDQTDYKNLNPFDRRRFFIFKIIPCLLCVIFGFTIMIVSSTMSIKYSLQGSGDDQHCVDD